MRTLTADEKAAFRAACDRLVAGTLTPTYIPEIRMDGTGYPVDILGTMRAAKYSFIVRSKSAYPQTFGQEFDDAFARIDHDEASFSELRFHVMWLRHTGKWWPLHVSVTLEEALRLVETEPLLRPVF